MTAMHKTPEKQEGNKVFVASELKTAAKVTLGK